MNIRFVTKTVHAVLDYPVALSLMETPFLLGLGHANPLALWVSVATGVQPLQAEHEGHGDENNADEAVNRNMQPIWHHSDYTGLLIGEQGQNEGGDVCATCSHPA